MIYLSYFLYFSVLVRLCQSVSMYIIQNIYTAEMHIAFNITQIKLDIQPTIVYDLETV